MGFFDLFRPKDEGTIKAERLDVDDDQVDEAELEDDELEAPKEAPEDREESGPFDESEAPEETSYIDFGALRIPVVEGMGVRVEFHETTRAVVGIAIDLDGSSLQLQAFATPRSSGLWKPVRKQLIASLEQQGATVGTEETEVGTAVVATMTPPGTTKQRTLKFVGVDGPRWFVRGVVSGPAARDEELFAPLLGFFRAIVVVRGAQAVPPRDLLAMKMPEALAEQMRARAEAQQSANE